MSDENIIELLDESPAEKLNDSLPHEQTCNSILNIINNNKNVSKKVILLSGVRGSGKTTIIQKLIRENKKDKIFITIDAWNAPEYVLKKEFLRCLYRGISNDSNKRLQKKIEDNIKSIDTIRKETTSNISSFTIIIYSFIFILIPIFIPILTTDRLLSLILEKTEHIPIDNIIIFFVEHFSITLLITTFLFFVSVLFFYNIIFPSKITKILFPFLYGSSDNYSEYEEGRDFTPYQFEKFIKDFYKLYSYFFGKKDIVIIVDNMDRLSKDEEEKFISSLYTFIECMQKEDNSINTWFILAVDKKSIGKNDSSVDSSFYDKLSPYEIIIPAMNNILVGSYFEKELFDNFDNNIIKEIENLDLIYLLLNFFNDDNYTR